MQSLADKTVYLVSGIGNPVALRQQLQASSAKIVGEKTFGDHHAYDSSDLEKIQKAAQSAGAAMIVTTEKDWMKLQRFARAAALPFGVLQLQIEFFADEERRLLEQLAIVMV